MKRMGAIESDSVKPPRKAQDKLHKACERASETERTFAWAGTKQCACASMRESVIDF